MYANVERYYPGRGFGLAITLDKRTIFFHVSNFAESPETVEYGDLLEFDTIPTPKGLRAVRITRIDCEPPTEPAELAGG